MELVEIIRGAQDAMDRGDYRLSAAACNHVLDTFPSSLTAHRMRGESLLELGEIDRAIEHFQRAIAVDPLNVVARLGLGVASEEKRDMNLAYSAYLHAWEVNPALEQVRDELVRLRGLLGGDDRLHPTRSGLAGIYARSGQFGRAAAEWRAVLLTEPDSQRARTSLAEVHWRSGDDNAALATSRDALMQNPENVRALAMIADIETRRNTPAAAEYIDRYQFADPAGEIAVILQDWREELDLSFLRRESAEMAPFDFSATPLEDRAPIATVAAAAVPGLASSQFGAPDLWDSLVQDFKPGTGPANQVGATQPDVQPFAWFEDGQQTANGFGEEIVPFSLESLSDPYAPQAAMAPAAPPADAFAQEFAQLAGAGNASIPPVAPASPPPAPPVMAPVAAAPEVKKPEPKAKPRDQFVNADGGIDLTVGWDDLDRQLKEATPKFEANQELDALMAQLGVDGVQPFEVADSTFDESAWAPFTDDDAPLAAAPVPTQAPVVPAPPAIDPFYADAVADEPIVPAPLAVDPFYADAVADEPVAAEMVLGEAEGWDIDHDLLAAIPGQRSSGYTELFRHVDTEFPVGDASGEEINPFANPDSAGTPLDFEDLLAVTSRDGTAPLHNALLNQDEERPGSDRLVDSTWEPPVAAGSERLNTDSLVSEQPFGFAPEPALDDLNVAPFVFAAEPVINELPAAFAPEPIGDELAVAPFSFDEPFVPGEASLPDAGLSDLLADLGDVQPFSLDEGFPVERAASDGAVDFSEINEAPFDLATLPTIATPPAAQPVTESVIEWSKPAEMPVAAQADEWHEEVIPTIVPPAAVEMPAMSAGNGLGIRPGSVAWPAFVNHTSELIDRGFEGGNLFLRLRENKRAASAAGILVIDRSITELRPQAAAVAGRPVMQVVTAEEAPVQEVTYPQPLRPGWMTEEERLDLMAMRVRLIDDDGSAQEIADLLEIAVSRGLSDPLALRVLGEAYLKLGKTDQAAAQFRHAMLERRRSR